MSSVNGRRSAPSRRDVRSSRDPPVPPPLVAAVGSDSDRADSPAAMRSAARSRTEAARGLAAISSGLASSAPRVSSRIVGPVPGSSTGRSGGEELRARSANTRLMIRSSNEW